MHDVTSHLIDSRIGVLIREGVQLYYAFIDGEYVEDVTAQRVKARLDGVAVESVAAPTGASRMPADKDARAEPKLAFRRFVVEVTPKMKVYAGGWQNGVHTVEVYACDGREAISKARREYRENNDVPAGFKVVDRD